MAAQAAPQGDVDDDTEESPPPQVAKKPAGRAAAPQPKAPQALVTRNASDTESTTDTENTSNTTATAQAVQWPDPPASMMARPEDPATTSVAPAQAVPAQSVSDAPASAAIAQQPDQQPAVTVDTAAPAPAAGAAPAVTGGTSGSTFALQFVFAIIAFVGLVACPIFYLAGVRLRRTDVLNKAQHLNAMPAEVRVSPRAPTFQPLPPMDLMQRRDDVEEAMQRFAERWKRRAA